MIRVYCLSGGGLGFSSGSLAQLAMSKTSLVGMMPKIDRLVFDQQDLRQENRTGV
jgi:hypothetical protein